MKPKTRSGVVSANKINSLSPRLAFTLAFLIFSVLMSAASLQAQSPNTATMIVVVVDQNGAVVPGAKVSVVNTATGAGREAVSGSDGSATFSALSLTGTYTVGVSRQGFGNEELKDITLRSGETATLKMKLVVGSEKAERSRLADRLTWDISTTRGRSSC